MAIELPEIKIDLGNDMWLETVTIADLKEQDINAQIMSPATLQRLTENIAGRKQLESVPYCAQPNGEGPIEIISGHHRVRAARAAGFVKVICLIDRSDLTRSHIVAKQLAHNALIGSSDPDVMKVLIARMDDVDHLLESGVTEDLLPTPDKFTMTLFTPHAEYRYKTCHFVFLTHQVESMEDLVKSIPTPRDVVCLACEDQFEQFMGAVSAYARAKKILSAATAVAMLIETAHQQIQQELGAEPAARGWVNLADVVGSGRIPQDAAQVIRAALDKLQADGDVGLKNRWQGLGFLAAEYLGGIQHQEAVEPTEEKGNGGRKRKAAKESKGGGTAGANAGTAEVAGGIAAEG